MDWIGLLSGLAAIAAALIKIWMDNAPERLKAAEDAKTQQGRTDIVVGDVGALESRIDGVLAGEAGTADSATGVESAEDVERRIGQL